MGSSLPSVKPSLLPSSLPSVKPSSLPSVYVCKDVTDKVAFTKKKKGWSCKKLRKNKKKDKICKKIFDARRQCAITCNSCPTSLPSVKPSSLPSVMPSLLPSSLPSVKPSLLPSSLPSVKPSSLPSVYVCKDVTDKVAFTRKKKGWSCKKLSNKK